MSDKQNNENQSTDDNESPKSNKPLDQIESDKSNTDKHDKSEQLTKMEESLKQESLKQESLKQAATKPSPSASPNATKKQANKPASEKPVKTGRVIAVLALLLSVSAIGGLGYVMWHGHQFAQQQSLVQQSAQTQLQSQVDILSDQLTLANQTFQKQIQKSDSQQQTTIASLVKFEEQLAATQDQRPNDWLIAETHYLVSLAARKLYIEADHATAFTLLTDAQTRLNAIADPSIMQVRQAIASDITRLQTIDEVDKDSLYLLLAGWTKQVKTLPLKLSVLPESAVVVEEDLALSDSVGDWRSNLAKTWRNFANTFFTIRKHDEALSQLTTPQQKWLLQQQLQLKFQQAQLAVLQQNQTVFEAAISDLVSTFTSEYDQDDNKIKRVLTDLNFALSQNVQPSIPLQLDSLSSLTKLVNQRVIGKAKQQQSMPAEQNLMPQPAPVLKSEKSDDSQGGE